MEDNCNKNGDPENPPYPAPADNPAGLPDMGYPAWVLSTPYPGMAATSTPNAPTTTLVALSDTAIPAKPTPLPPEVFCRKDAPGDYIYPPIDLTKLHWETSLVVGRTAQRLDGLTAPPYMGSHSPDGLDIIQIASSNP